MTTSHSHRPSGHRHHKSHGRHHGDHEGHAAAPEAHAGADVGRLKKVLLVLCIAQLMVILDISAVNVALPDLAGSLDLASGDLGWTITSYSLIFGSLLLLGGRAADLLGRRRVFLTGLGVFTAASLAAASAQTAETLFAARGLQGLGAAMLSPAALSILMSTFASGQQRAHALAAWGAVGGAGAAVGMLLGGTLTALVGWQAIFLINLPVGIALAVAARSIIPADVAAPSWRGLDLRGGVIATASLGAIVYSLSQAAVAGWGSTQTLVVGLGGLVGLAAFVIVERHTAQPLLRVERLANRAVGGGFLLMLAASATLFGSFLLVSLYLQNVLASGPMETGLAFLPFAVAIAGGVHAANHLLSHAGLRPPMAIGFGATTGGMLLLSKADAGGSYVADVLPGMLVAGLGLGVVLVSVAVSVMTSARDEETGMLSGLNTTGHEIGGSLGIAAVTTVVASSVAAATPAIVASGIGDAFVVLAGVAGVAAVAAPLILPPAASFLPELRRAPRVAVH